MYICIYNVSAVPVTTMKIHMSGRPLHYRATDCGYLQVVGKNTEVFHIVHVSCLEYVEDKWMA